MKRLALAMVLAGAGCTYSREVGVYHALSGLPGVRSGRPSGGSRFTHIDPTLLPEDALVVEQEDGSVKLVARSGRHLMVHIYNCLKNDDAALFTEQVLSSVTKQEYEERGLDPKKAFESLKQRQNDLVALFNLMPSGEHTPGVMWKPLGEVGERGEKVVRLSVAGPQTRDMRWDFMDMVMERGNWRLRWFGKE